MKITFIGIGNVGFSIANNLQKLGYEIIIGNNNINSTSVKNAIEKNPDFKLMPVQEAVNQAEIVFLATPFEANGKALKGIIFNGKILVDCTNPVGEGISHGLDSKISGAEQVQSLAKDANVVKAFTIYGFENFIDSSYPDYKVNPVMLIAGNDINSKNKLSNLINELGFFPKDVGNLSMSLHLEHMTLLWVKMVRANGHHPNFVWAYLER